MRKFKLVFVPMPSISHLDPFCKFAEKLVERDKRLCVTILIIRPTPLWESSIDAYTKRISSAPEGNRIRYITLAQIEPPYSEELENYRPIVKDAIISNKSWPGTDSNPKIVGLVIDMFCTSMIDVANELDIPSYLFFTSGAAFLDEQFNPSDGDLNIAAYTHPVPSKVLPTFAFVKEGYDSFRNHGVRYKETKGILIDTVEEFESHAVNSLASDPELPPVYTVGFLLDLEAQNAKGNSKSKDEEIKKWLDQQPPSSVLFLCFGSAVELTLNDRMHDSDHRGIVKAAEIEKVIRRVMDSENSLRKRVKDMGEICRKALTEGGSSFISLGRFVETILDT
ncbi:hypothetical protein R3W88_019771 [Solanum pinnatisectum]|uniref:Uncharacterized protein n=1 Tax=Solanum pinnatisectum TaxID=50273 RepID=A0AAV9KKL6_9SOLN|nr:hypothetical protein R3W88_019771 [Solanum pinnatisectum]